MLSVCPAISTGDEQLRERFSEFIQLGVIFGGDPIRIGGKVDVQRDSRLWHRHCWQSRREVGIPRFWNATRKSFTLT